MEEVKTLTLNEIQLGRVIPEGRLPYIRTRQALSEIAAAGISRSAFFDGIVKRAVSAAAEADKKDEFMPPLPLALSETLQDVNTAMEDYLALQRLDDDEHNPQYAIDGYKVLKVVDLLGAIVDYGSGEQLKYFAPQIP